MIIIKKQAAKEIKEAVAWYESKLEGLGARFYSNLFRSMNILNDFPELYQIVDGDIRKLKLSKFPYCIYYNIRNNGDVLISKCRHTKRL